MPSGTKIVDRIKPAPEYHLHEENSWKSGIFNFLPSLWKASIQMPVLELLLHFCHRRESISYICANFAYMA
jgi:hypothetical protein